MTNPTYDPGPSTPIGSTVDYSSDPGSESKTDTAKQEASAVKDSAVDSAKNVAGTAKEQASSVAAEAGQQAKDLLGNARQELSSQASTQQQRLGDVIHGFAKELGSLAAGSDQPGVITDLAQQAAYKGGEVAHWLQNREPADLLEDVRGFARRRPVTFLLACGLAGVVAGRLTRGVVATKTSLDSPSEPTPAAITADVPAVTEPEPFAARGLDSGYTAEPGYTAQPGYTAEPGYTAQPGYTADPSYTAQPGYPAQPGYTAAPGYTEAAGYPSETGYPVGTEYPADPFGVEPDRDTR